MLCPGGVGKGAYPPLVWLIMGGGTGVLGLTLYLPIIFLRADSRIFHGNTLTSFSMLRGLGLGKPMMILKNSSLSGLALETVCGWKPSKLRRIRFFSSTLKRFGAATSCSRRWIVSTDVT